MGMNHQVKSLGKHAGTSILLLLSLYLPVSGQGAPVIVPAVQQIDMKEGVLSIDDSWAILADLSDPDESFNAHYLRDELRKEFNLKLSVADAASTRARSPGRILIGKPGRSPHVARIARQKNLALDTVPVPEGYILDSSLNEAKGDILVLSETSAGVFHGIQSLLKHPDGAFQSIFTENGAAGIELFTVTDWPDKPIRGAILRTSQGHGNLANFEWITIMARLKMNFVVLGETVTELADLGSLYDHARRYYMEPVPFLRGLESSPFPMEDPNIAEGLAVADESFFFRNIDGAYVAEPVSVVDQTFLIQNAGFEAPVSESTKDWYFTKSGDWTWDTSEAHSGIASVRMDVADDPDREIASGFLMMTRDSYIPVEGGKTYVISFWAKTQGVGDTRVPYVMTAQFNEAYQATPNTNRGITRINLPKGSSDWKQYFQPIQVANDTRYLRLNALTDTGGYGTVWLDDFEIRRMDGALVNVVRTDTTDITIRSNDNSTVYEEHVDYRVIDGELNYGTLVDGVVHRFYPLHRPTRIELISGGRIDPSDTVNISYDLLLHTVTGRFHNPVYSINEGRTYARHVYPYLEEMVAALDPAYVLYGGPSEVSGMNRDSRNIGMENHELLAKDINNVYGHLKTINPKVKILLWDDMMNPWHNGGIVDYQTRIGGGKLGATEPRNFSLPRTTDLIPRDDIIQWVWQYTEEDPQGKRANSPDYFEGKGFQWVAGTRDDMVNMLDWANIINNRNGCIGMIDWAYAGYDGIVGSASLSWNNGNLTY